MEIGAICIAVAVFVIVVFSILERKPWKKQNKAKTEVAGVGVRVAKNYNHYKMTRAQKLRYTAMAAVVLFAVGYIFFKSIYLCIALCGFSFLYLPAKKKSLIKKMKNDLNLQFRDALHSISSSLCAGRSVEGAFKASLGDLNILYPDEDAYIIKELELINRKVDMNEPIENALMDFSARAYIDDITSFVDVFLICKSTGGNLVEVIKNTSNVINQKIEIKNEIEVIVAEQKLSQKILSIMPFGLLILIMLSSPEYVQPLYSLKGHAVMLVVLALLGAAYFIGTKIMDIKV